MEGGAHLVRESLQLRLDILRGLDLCRVHCLDRLHLAVGLLQGLDPAIIDIALDYPADNAGRQRHVLDHRAEYFLDILSQSALTQGRVKRRTDLPIVEPLVQIRRATLQGLDLGADDAEIRLERVEIGFDGAEDLVACLDRGISRETGAPSCRTHFD